MQVEKRDQTNSAATDYWTRTAVASARNARTRSFRFTIFIVDIEEREKERERGSNLRRQRLASPTAQMLVAQTTRPVQKNRLRDEL